MHRPLFLHLRRRLLRRSVRRVLRLLSRPHPVRLHPAHCAHGTTAGALSESFPSTGLPVPGQKPRHPAFPLLPQLRFPPQLLPVLLPLLLPVRPGQGPALFPPGSLPAGPVPALPERAEAQRPALPGPGRGQVLSPPGSGVLPDGHPAAFWRRLLWPPDPADV